MTTERTHYDTLGITPGAPQEIVNAVYRAWMKAMRAHPDLGGDEEQAKAINAAYEVLSDPKKRAHYDAELAAEKRVLERGMRRAPRVAVDVEVAINAIDAGSWERARVRDASALGLCILSVRVLKPSEHLSIAFPGRRDRAHEAVVRWVKGIQGEGPWRCEAGVEFFHPIPEVLRLLGQKGHGIKP